MIRAKTGLDSDQSGLIAHFFKKIRTSNLHLQQPPSTAEVIETAKAMQLTGLEITEQNLLRMHTHWIKHRIDFNALEAAFKTNGEWEEMITE